MLFNSFIFIFAFLPATLFLFFYAARYSHKIALSILFIASLIFYGWNDYNALPLLLGSISINFLIGYWMGISLVDKKKYCLWIGVIFNLSLLAYFKYTNFFIDNINAAMHVSVSEYNIILPIGISFFTFTQIAYLVDNYRGLIKQYNFLNYALFVSYFPHLIAGPIIHHAEVMPQFEKKQIFSFRYRNLVLGILCFSIGLFKKTILADQLANFVGPVYDMHSANISCLDAWISSLAYTLELYFDFSAYSDMAIGLSLLIGVKLPVNFYSPYKANNIIEFWRRWNMTLSRFLRDYLYIPLGGNRQGIVRRYINLIITMFLGGLWHGANWTFIAWGCLHGTYLCCNHGWNALKEKFSLKDRYVFLRPAGYFLTFLAVIIAWVFFRAENFSIAKKILYAMFFKPIVLPGYWHIPSSIKAILLKLHIGFSENATWNINDPVASFYSISIILISLIIVWFMPNTYQIMQRYRPALLTWVHTVRSKLYWKPNVAGTFFSVIAFCTGVLFIHTSSIFLYFRF